MPPSSAKRDTHDLYAEQLLPLNLGYPLYDPDPGVGAGEVEIGDVGFNFYGRFMRFASVFSTTTHNQAIQVPAIEEDYHKIISFTSLDKGVMASHSVSSGRAEFTASASVIILL